MITPRFEVEQTDSDVTFTIHAPYASIADAEIYADLDIFCFYASPYYLRLHLPGHIEETDSSKGSYDADKGTFIICVQKVRKGEHFPDLDLITSLLTPRQPCQKDAAKPKIEVVCTEETSTDSLDHEDQINSCDDEDDEWYIDQKPFEEPSKEFLLFAPRYGFANQLSGAFHNFKTEFLEVIELPDPDITPASKRCALRIERETEDFSEDHYLADWAQPDLVEPLLQYKSPWEESLESDKKVTLDDKEKDVMKDLPKKEFLLDKCEECIAGLSLVDILFAYAYNTRSTMGENTVESAWTINKLSATLSWLQSFCTMHEVVVASIRRSLSYPLYRQWKLSLRVLQDVRDILKLGRKQVLKCLLEIYSIFSNSEPRYLLNQLYIRDYCVWIQQLPESRLESLRSAIDKVHPKKSDIGLELEELEIAAEIVRQEEEQLQANATVRNITSQVSSLKLDENEKDTSSGSSDSCSSSSSDLDSDDLTDSD